MPINNYLDPYTQWYTEQYGGLYNLPNTATPVTATPTSKTSDYLAYLEKYPDVMKNYANVNKAQFPTPESYAQFHYQQYGQFEGRDSPNILGQTATTPTTTLLSDLVQPTPAEIEDSTLPKRGDPNIQAAGRAGRIGAMRRGGRQSTILTSGRGVTNQVLTQRPRAISRRSYNLGDVQIDRHRQPAIMRT